MNTRRQGAFTCASTNVLPVALAVLLVFTAFLTLSGAAWAQYGFPFLDPNNSRAQMLANAFGVQMGLLMGGTGGLPALTLLASLAAVVGGIVLVFRRDFNPSIIASWLLVVVIVIFVPLNSTLLFSPIKVSEPQTIISATSDNNIPQVNRFNGNPCGSDDEAWKGCGFTPQLVAIHITSVVQVILSDLFRSQGWRGLIERQIADSMLRTRPEFKLSEAWLLQSNRFVERCNGQTTLGDLLSDTNQRAGSNNQTAGSPHRFGELWQRWGAEFAGNSQHNKRPFIALLPMTVQEAKQYGWGEYPSSLYSDYEAAIGAIYNNLVPSQQTKTVRFNPSGTNQISVQTALNTPDFGEAFLAVTANTTGGSRESPDISVNPGFFMMPLKFADSTNSPQAASRTCYFQDQVTAEGYLQAADRVVREIAGAGTSGAMNTNYNQKSCLSPLSGVFSTGIPGIGLIDNAAGVVASIFRQADANLSVDEAAQRKLIWGKPDNQWATYNFIQRRLSRQDAVSAAITKPWQVFLQNYSLIAQMPVIFGDAERGSGRKSGLYEIKPFTPLPWQSCKDLGQDLLNEAIKQLETPQNGGVQSDQYLQPYLQMLRGTRPIPEGQITVDDIMTGITASQLRSQRPQRYAFINMLADDANNTLLTSNVRNKPSNEKRAALINRFVRIAQDVTGQTYSNLNRSAAADADRDGRNMNPQLVGNSTFTEIAGNLSFAIGTGLIWAYSWIIGPVAMATIQFLNVMIDLAVFGVIVITPLLLIAGLFQPRKAAGYLVISVMVVFVLKFVPISLIILNNIAGMVYELLPSALGMNASLAQNLMMIGLASLYTGLISFTLYLLFKSGDPASTIGALSNFDKAAKQAADAGFKALAAVALAPIGAGVLGSMFALAGKYAPLLNKAAKAAGIGKGDDSAKGDGTSGGKGGGGTGGAMAQAKAPESDGNLLNGDVNTNTANVQDSSIKGMLLDEGFSTGDINAGVDAGRQNSANSTPDADGNRTGTFQLGRDGKMFNVTGKFDPSGKLLAASYTDEGGNFRQYPPAETTGPIGGDTTGDTAGQDTLDINNPADKAGEGKDGTQDIQTANLVSGAGSGTSNVGAEPAKNTAAQLVTKTGTPAPENKIKTEPKATTMAQVNSQIEARAGQSEKWVETYQQMHSIRRTPLAQKLSQAIEAKDQDAIEYYTKRLDELDKFDATKGNMGDAISFLSKFDAEQLKMEQARTGADVKPGMFKVMASGFLGGFKAVGGGVGGIPVIGNILKGSLNEYYEAPERAKAWQAAGGFMKHWTASGDAQRMKYYQQEISPLATGYQYQQMELVGAFQAMPESARFQVAQSVAKMRSDYEALMSKAFGEGKFTLDDLKAGTASVNVSALDLQGLGRVSAASNIGSVWGEAAAMQGDSWKVEVWDEAKKEFVKQSIKPNVTALSRIYSDLGVKQAGKYFDEAMTNWYGIVEKQYERGSADWNPTRNMSSNKAAAAKFINEDISTDYIVAGHLKMVQGKQNFFGYRGSYEAFLQLRNKEEGMKYEKIIESPLKVIEHMQKNQAALKLSDADIQNAQIALKNVSITNPGALKNFTPQVYGAISKAAGEMIGKTRLPLNAIFEEAYGTNFYSILQKSAVAPYNVAALKEGLAGAVLKAQTSLLESTGISKSVQRQINFEVDNVRYGLDKMTARTTERAMSTYGEKVGGIFMETFAKVLNKKGSDFAEKAMVSLTKSITAEDGKGNSIKIGKEAYHEISAEMEEALQKALDEEKLGIKVSDMYVEKGTRKLGLIEAYYEDKLTEAKKIGIDVSKRMTREL